MNILHTQRHVCDTGQSLTEITDRKPQNLLFMNCRLLKHFPSSMPRGFMAAAELSLNLSSFDAFSLQCHSVFLSSTMTKHVLSFLLPKLFLSFFLPSLFFCLGIHTCFLVNPGESVLKKRYSKSWKRKRQKQSEPLKLTQKVKAWDIGSAFPFWFIWLERDIFTYAHWSLDPFTTTGGKKAHPGHDSVHGYI